MLAEMTLALLVVAPEVALSGRLREQPPTHRSRFPVP
jgi:hypothetical protein